MTSSGPRVYYLQRHLETGETDELYLTRPWAVGEWNFPAPVPRRETQEHYNRPGVEVLYTHVGQRNLSLTVHRRCNTYDERLRALSRLQQFLYPEQPKPARIVCQYADESRRAADILPDPGIDDSFTNDSNFHLSGQIQAMSTEPYFYSPDPKVIPINNAVLQTGYNFPAAFPALWVSGVSDKNSADFRNEGDVAVYPKVYITGGNISFARFMLLPERVVVGARGNWRWPGAGWYLQIDPARSGEARNVRLNAKYEVVEEGSRLRNLLLLESNPRLFELKPKHRGAAANSIEDSIRGSSSVSAFLLYREQFGTM